MELEASSRAGSGPGGTAKGWGGGSSGVDADVISLPRPGALSGVKAWWRMTLAMGVGELL